MRPTVAIIRLWLVMGVRNKQLVAFAGFQDPVQLSTQILRTCKLFLDEGRCVLCSQNSFQLYPGLSPADFENHTSSENAGLIRQDDLPHLYLRYEATKRSLSHFQSYKTFELLGVRGRLRKMKTLTTDSGEFEKLQLPPQLTNFLKYIWV